MAEILKIFILLTVVAGTKSQCPSECSCAEGQINDLGPGYENYRGYRVICHIEGNLQKMTAAIPDNTKELQLRVGKLTRIDDATFRRYPFTNLKEMKKLSFLVQNEAEFKSSAFKTLTSLRYLRIEGLDKDKVQRLSTGLFEGTPSLYHFEISRMRIEPGLDRANWLSKLNVTGKLIISNTSLKDVKFTTYDKLTNLKELRLSGNKIKSLSNNTFASLKSLKILNLSGNAIHNVQAGAFENIGSIGELDLAKNNITEFKKGSFCNLGHLKNLSLSGNQLKMLKASAFCSLAFDNLDLSNNSFATFESEMYPLFTRSKVVNLTANPLHCNCELQWLKSISAAVSGKCVSPIVGDLENLQGSFFLCTRPSIVHAFSMIEPDGRNVTLACQAKGDPQPSIAWKLKDKVLSKHDTVDKKRDLVRDSELRMRKPNVTTTYTCSAMNSQGQATADVTVVTSPDLPAPTKCPAGCVCRSAVIRDLGPGFPDFKGMGATCYKDAALTNFDGFPDSIDELAIYGSVNVIKALRPKMFKGIPKLQKLTITDANLEEIHAKAFESLPKLRVLIISRHHLKSIDTAAFVNSPTLHYVSLAINQIISTDFLRFINVSDTLNLEDNQINDISFLSFPGLSRLRKLQLDRNNVTRIHYSTFENLRSLAHLGLSSNALEKLPQGFCDGLQELENIELQHNRLNELLPRQFGRLPKMDTLNLAQNTIASVHGTAFQYMPRLQSVQLESNRIAALEPGTFCQNPFLKAVFLQNNTLKVIIGSAFCTRSGYDTFDISKNRLSALNSSLLETIAGVTGTLNLGDNLFHCNCKMLWLKKFLDSSKLFFIGACKTPTAGTIQALNQSVFSCSPPTITRTRFSNLNASHVTLRCEAAGDPAPTIVWYRDWTTEKAAQTTSTFNTTNSLIYVVKSMVSKDYSCMAKNSFGVSPKHFWTVIDSPEPTNPITSVVPSVGSPVSKSENAGIQGTFTTVQFVFALVGTYIATVLFTVITLYGFRNCANLKKNEGARKRSSSKTRQRFSSTEI